MLQARSLDRDAQQADHEQVDTAEQVYISSLALLKMLKHGKHDLSIHSIHPNHLSHQLKVEQSKNFGFSAVQG